VDKPRNAEEQAFWDAVFLAMVRGLLADPTTHLLNVGWVAEQCDGALDERRRRTEQPDA
jgi:hypothetical protein